MVNTLDSFCKIRGPILGFSYDSFRKNHRFSCSIMVRQTRGEAELFIKVPLSPPRVAVRGRLFSKGGLPHLKKGSKVTLAQMFWDCQQVLSKNRLGVTSKLQMIGPQR